MRNRDVRQGNKRIDEINAIRRRNLGILFFIGTLLCLAFSYIIWSNLDKHFG